MLAVRPRRAGRAPWSRVRLRARSAGRNVDRTVVANSRHLDAGLSSFRPWPRLRRAGCALGEPGSSAGARAPVRCSRLARSGEAWMSVRLAGSAMCMPVHPFHQGRRQEAIATELVVGVGLEVRVDDRPHQDLHLDRGAAVLFGHECGHRRHVPADAVADDGEIAAVDVDLVPVAGDPLVAARSR